MRILGTTEISIAIERMVQAPSSYLIIVSPYLKLHRRLRPKMESGFRNIDRILFVYRANELDADEESWLRNFENAELYPVENLHAKVYVNQYSCLIASMNLYEYSQINNHELGVLISSEEEEAFRRVLEEIDLMIQSEGNSPVLEETIDEFKDYSSGQLFWSLMDRWNLRGSSESNSAKYYNFCMWVKSKYDFKEDQLYRDGSCLLKDTNLEKSQFMELVQFFEKEHFLSTPAGIPSYPY